MRRTTAGRIVFECDACDDEHEGERGQPHSECWSEASAKGWTTKQIGSDWLHACPMHKL